MIIPLGTFVKVREDAWDNSSGIPNGHIGKVIENHHLSPSSWERDPYHLYIISGDDLHWYRKQDLIILNNKQKPDPKYKELFI